MSTVSEIISMAPLKPFYVLFRDMLQLGSSKPWPDALEGLTGSRKMDASIIREYFKPLEVWLTENNERHQEFVGWEGGE